MLLLLTALVFAPAAKREISKEWLDNSVWLLQYTTTNFILKFSKDGSCTGLRVKKGEIEEGFKGKWSIEGNRLILQITATPGASRGANTFTLTQIGKKLVVGEQHCLRCNSFCHKERRIAPKSDEKRQVYNNKHVMASMATLLTHDLYLCGNSTASPASSTTFSDTTVASTCTATTQGNGVLYEPGANFPDNFTGLTDNADPLGTPVKKGS
jgi:hypothetical protein